MSEEGVQAVAAAGAFAPTGKPWLMSARHVPFDDVIEVGRYEQRVTDRLTRIEAVVLVGAER